MNNVITPCFEDFTPIFSFFFVSIVVALNFLNTESMNNEGFYLIYLAPIPFTIIATIGLFFAYEESATHIIENHNCPDCVTTRCPTCKEHI